jgi:NDP-sugar pyrophosphorylase family protein
MFDLEGDEQLVQVQESLEKDDLRAAIDAGQVGASVYPDRWVDVGTPERLAALNASGPVSAALH